MTTAYAAALARLVGARRFGVVLGTERMRALLDRLGAPDRSVGTIVHVGGTNGKGSTVAMIAALARAAGKRVAVYTSPHLSTLRERIVVDGALVTEDAFVAAYERVRAAGGEELTFFEQVTAIALVVFAAARPELTLLEVGLGGRLDATNAVTADVACVTGVAMDHEALLGGTLEAIAREKAGIFKPGQAIVIGASGEPAAVPGLVAAARAASTRVTIVDDARIAAVPPVGLAGEHQRRNAAAALAAIEMLGLTPDPRALAAVTHPGRFEIVGDVILDGAHNPHGAAALAELLRARGERPVLVLAISADKDVRAIARALLPACRGVIATRYQQERALDPATLANELRRIADIPVDTAPDLATALAIARGQGPIVIAGSLFLVGEARTLLLGAPTDPVLATDPSIAR